MLAQIPNVTPSAWHQATLIGIGVIMLLVSLSGAVVGWLSYAQSRKARHITPQPLKVEGVEKFQTLDGCASQHQHIAEEIDRVDRRVTEVDNDLKKFKQAVLDNGEARKNFIVAHVDSVRRELSNEIGNVHKRMDNFPDKLIALLRNTGVIK